jgi:hypothetical protein
MIKRFANWPISSPTRILKNNEKIDMNMNQATLLAPQEERGSQDNSKGLITYQFLITGQIG